MLEQEGGKGGKKKEKRIHTTVAAHYRSFLPDGESLQNAFASAG